MNRFVAMTLISVAVAQSLLAADQSDSGKLLLDQLRTERQAAVIDDSRVQASRPQIDLKPLLGVRREELVQSLGIPDFCALPHDSGCIKSSRIAYFFFPRKPSAAKHKGNGLVEVTVTAGGGWALEVNVAHNTVAKAYWAKQE